MSIDTFKNEIANWAKVNYENNNRDVTNITLECFVHIMSKSDLLESYRNIIKENPFGWGNPDQEFNREIACILRDTLNLESEQERIEVLVRSYSTMRRK